MKEILNNYFNRILDDYYNEKLINRVKERLKMAYDLDIKIETDYKYIKIYMKPIKYKNYTVIWKFERDKGLINLIDFYRIIGEIEQRIDFIEEKDLWD